ncbi:MAG: CBS domain-containing protein, partial [Candidatus Aenigmatarchaeota archaeon]
TVQDAADLLNKKGIKKMPIIDKGKLVGIVTMTDLIKSMMEIDEEHAEKLRGVCEELQKTKLRLQVKLNELERKK